MPELPEVETVRRTLARHVVGRWIESVELLSGRVVREMDPGTFVEGVVGRRIQGVDRRGKYLLIRLSDGESTAEPAIVVHLRMTGRLVYMNAGEPVEKHTAAVFHLDGGADLRFIDLRKFGLLHLLPHGRLDEYAPLQALGVEPLSEDFTPALLAAAAKKSRRPIKALLLDQTIIAGIGNIYADEALFRAGIHPSTPAASLTEQEVQTLAAAIRDVLDEGVRYRGTTFRNYADGDGRAGEMKERLAVYGRGKEKCLRCGAPLQKARIAGRGTTFCPRCQPGFGQVAKESLDGVQGEPARGRAVVVGLTGGIASGKSTVARILAGLGATIIDSDKIAHEVIEPGAPAYAAVVREFGPRILAGPGTNHGEPGGPIAIDRNKLARLVFADSAKRRALERIVHPHVLSELVKRRDDAVAEGNSPVVVLDIPLLFEVGAQDLVDLTMVVSVPEEVQLQRLMARDGLTKEEALARLDAQLPLKEKAELADVVIDNSRTVDSTEKQVMKWWQKITAQKARATGSIRRPRPASR